MLDILITKALSAAADSAFVINISNIGVDAGRHINRDCCSANASTAILNRAEILIDDLLAGDALNVYRKSIAAGRQQYFCGKRSEHHLPASHQSISQLD